MHIVTPCKRGRFVRSVVAGIAAFVLAMQMVRHPGPLPWTLYWMSAGMMVLLPATGAFDDGWRWFQRLAAHALRSIVAPIIDLVRWRRVRRARFGRRFSLSDKLHGIAPPVIGSGVILLLFVAANPVLAQWIDRLTGPGVWEVDVVRIMIWIVVLVAAFPDLPANLPMPRGDRRCDGHLKPPPALPAPVGPTLTLKARP